MTDKILLAIQFWQGDKEAAMKAARLVADLQPSFTDDVEFLFVARYDCQQDLPTIEYVSRKFKTHHVISRRRASGWPHGCNELWFATMDYVYTLGEAKRMPEYKAVLTFESDSFPLCPNWLQVLSAAWDKAKTKVFGAMQSSPGPHVNGNAFFSGDKAFLHHVARKISGCTPRGGWDFVLAPAFKKLGWANCPEMRSWWQLKTCSETTYEQLLREGVVFLHGCKDDSVLKLVRAKYLGN